MSDRQSEPSNLILAVKWAYRWDIFRRLTALEIDCQCATNEPLIVDLHSPTTLVQIWSVVRQFNLERHQLVNWLDNCWYVRYDRQSK